MDQRPELRFNHRKNNRDNSGQCESQDLQSGGNLRQDELDHVQDQNQNITAENAKSWPKERKRLCLRIHKLKYDLMRVNELMELREKEFTAVHKKNYDTITLYESQISSLKTSLQSQEDSMKSMQSMNYQETHKMTACLEAEHQKVSKQSEELLKLTLENQKTVLLKNQLQIKVNQLQQQLQDKDKQLLDLHRVIESLSQRLLKYTKNVSSDGADLVESDRALQEKHNVPQETFRGEFSDLAEEIIKKQKEVREVKQNAQREDSLIVQLMEIKEELKSAKVKFQNNKACQEKCSTLPEVEGTDNKEESVNVLQKDQREPQEEVERQKVEKKEKDERKTFWSWMHRKNLAF